MPQGIRTPEIAFNTVEAEYPNIEELAEETAWHNELTAKKKGVYSPTLKNTVLFLENDPGLKGIFAVNEFLDRMVLIGAPPWEEDRTNHYRLMNDNEVNHLMVYLSNKYNIEPSPARVWQAIDFVASRRTFHPVREFLY
jgi:predicted P-loop ATPase